MSMKYNYKGRVYELMPVQTFASGFKKRDLVCETTVGKFTDYAVFTAKKELADRIATLKPGDEVTVDFALDGHSWEKDGAKRWFGGATAIKVELVGVNAGSMTSEDQPTPTESEADVVNEDLPF